MSPILRDSEIRKLIAGSLIFLAVSGNGFFIKRLVDKIDRIDEIEKDIRQIKWRLGLAAQYPEPIGPKNPS